MLLEPRIDFYESGHPQPRDIFLLVEVADATVYTDRAVKIPLYAENNIVEIWLVDINDQCLEVYRQPLTGRYQDLQKFYRTQTIAIQAFPDVEIPVSDIFN